MVTFVVSSGLKCLLANLVNAQFNLTQDLNQLKSEYFQAICHSQFYDKTSKQLPNFAGYKICD